VHHAVLAVLRPEQVEQATQWLKAHAPAPQASQSKGQGKEWCGKHRVTMKLNHGKDGRSWYSHRLDDGTFCKGR
jgi:hypothetical protein